MASETDYRSRNIASALCVLTLTPPLGTIAFSWFSSGAFGNHSPTSSLLSPPATDLTRGNLDQLLIRASTDFIRTKINQAAEPRLQKP